jgi:hypothetical protein
MGECARLLRDWEQLHAHGTLLLKRALLYNDAGARCVALAMQAESRARRAQPGAAGESLHIPWPSCLNCYTPSQSFSTRSLRCWCRLPSPNAHPSTLPCATLGSLSRSWTEMVPPM